MNDFWLGVFTSFGIIASILFFVWFFFGLIKHAVYLRYLFVHNCFARSRLEINLEQGKDPLFRLTCRECMNEVKFDLKTIPANYLDYFKNPVDKHVTAAMMPEVAKKPHKGTQ